VSNKSVFSFRRRVYADNVFRRSTTHCFAPYSNPSISPVRRAHSSKPDTQTLLDPHSMRVVPKFYLGHESRVKCQLKENSKGCVGVAVWLRAETKKRGSGNASQARVCVAEDIDQFCLLTWQRRACDSGGDRQLGQLTGRVAQRQHLAL